MRLVSIEVVEDRTAESRCDEGFLRIARLRVKNRYDDGSESEVYPCDVMTRRGSDAVVAVLYELDEEGQVQVLLRESPRVPIYLRKHKHFEHPDPREYLCLHEVVAGLVEEGDGAGLEGLRRRAAIESAEEAGIQLDPAGFVPLGGEVFASPGTTDEKLYYLAAELPRGRAAAAAAASRPAGDGSVMEEWSELHTLELGDAIRACRDGRIPDMKTEVALLRLADHLGWLPQLGCFARDLPQELRARLGSSGPPR